MKHVGILTIRVLIAIFFSVSGLAFFPDLTFAAPDCDITRDLDHADLSGCDLIGADLSGAHLLGATLTGAKLSLADLGGADLRNADLGGAEMRQANLGGANLGVPT